MNENLSQFQALLGLVCLGGALWVAMTGRLVGRRLPDGAQRLTWAGAMACLGLAALSQAVQHWIGHGIELTLVGLVAVTAAAGLGIWSLRIRRRTQ
jgi:alcohol dehydrogenase YqhD (iron-dependent ADH family)